VWVGLVTGEIPSPLTLTAGLVVIGTVVVRGIYQMRKPVSSVERKNPR
jgi:hypothetical protein